MEKKLITLLEASRLTPFDANYLGLLVRKKRLFAVKKNGKWFTTRDAMKEYMAQNARKEKVTEVYKRQIGKTFFSSTIVSLVLFVGAFFGFIFAENSTKSDVSAVNSYVVTPKYKDEMQNEFVISEIGQASTTVAGQVVTVSSKLPQ